MDDGLQNNEKREKLVRAGEMNSMHWLIVLLSVVLTFSAWYYSQFQQSQKLEIQFEREAEKVVNLVKERMTLYENVLWGGVAYIDAVDSDLTHQQWSAYSKSLQIDTNYPGINGFGIIYNVQPKRLDSYLQKQRIDRPDYKIHPAHGNPEYWPITYVEPQESNKQAIGLDVAFENNRYSSIKKARDSGKALLTAPITLVQDDKQTPGFLFYTPFYQNGLKPDTLEQRKELIAGVTYAPFIMEKLMKGTLAEKNRHVSIQISDGQDLLFDDNLDGDTLEVDTSPLFAKDIDVSMYGRTWTFSIQSNISFRQDTTLNQSSIILIGGLIIDALLLVLFLYLSKANRQALKYADQMTTELKDQTQHLEKLNINLEKSNSDLEQFSYVASHDLKSPLNAIEQLASWIEEDCEDILPDESKEHLVLLRQRSKRMLKLLDDLLDYSRLNLTTVTNDKVNLAEKAQDILSLLESNDHFSCTAPNIEINIPQLPFEIVLRNLISNSIKHHDKKTGQITIHYVIKDNFHQISLEDDGPGIPEAFHDKAMEMFQTLQSRDKVEGSGMGLAMIKRIVVHYHGSVNIISDGKHGTKINILWPLTP
ncbi:CHASE domain-containing protein [Psychromonas sp. SP041]|uniref:CHASE domain-containing protein n=1 Tax=Psychromonas sp. SP041 TaxID=1365007 RepID=UPI000404F452|nr:CHASE domain-containing protein [Psychromonas sp. SP041]